jgi:hypothetical protein
VFFRGRYVFRSRNGTLAVVAGLSAGTIFAALAVSLFATGEDLLAYFGSAGFACVSLFFGGIGLRALYNLIRGHENEVELNGEGIIDGDRCWSWDQVRSVAGKSYGNGVCLEFTPRKLTIGLGVGSLPTTPLLADEEYVALASELSRYLSAHFPDVAVAPHPQVPDGH